MTTGSSGQGLGGRKAGGAGGRVEAGDGADEEGTGQAEGQGRGRDDGLPVFVLGVADGDEGAEGAAGETAEKREGEGFADELAGDVPAGRPEGAAQADLTAAFEHRDDHDVGDADRADQDGDDA